MNYTQEPQKQEGYLLKKRKWPLKGWHKVRNELSSQLCDAVKVKVLGLVFLSKHSTAGFLRVLNLMHYIALYALLLKELFSLCCRDASFWTKAF